MSYLFTRIPSPANNPILPCVHCETQTRHLSRTKKPQCSVCGILIKRGEKPQTLKGRIPDKSTPEITAAEATGIPELPKNRRSTREEMIERVRVWDRNRRALGYDTLPKNERHAMCVLARKVGYKQMPFKSSRAKGAKGAFTD